MIDTITMVTVTVKYSVQYENGVTEDEIDISDIIRNNDAITSTEVKIQKLVAWKLDITAIHSFIQKLSKYLSTDAKKGVA